MPSKSLSRCLKRDEATFHSCIVYDHNISGQLTWWGLTWITAENVGLAVRLTALQAL